MNLYCPNYFNRFNASTEHVALIQNVSDLVSDEQAGRVRNGLGANGIWEISQ